MAETLMQTPLGDFQIQLFPHNPKSTFRAWDSADLYLIEELVSRNISTEATALILNDSHGALALALGDRPMDLWQDSHIQRQAIDQNLKLNRHSSGSYKINQTHYDLVIIKIPKTLSLLEYQLRQIRDLISKETLILAGGMTRHIHSSTLDCFSRIIGPTSSSLAKKKARLIFCQKEESLQPKEWQEWVEYSVPGISSPLRNLPSLFSREKLDRGTSLLLNHLPQWDNQFQALDFGCGNGVIAIASALKNPQGQYCCIDDSELAVLSAERNAKELQLSNRIEVYHRASIKEGKYNLILSNPPFHQGQRVDLGPARTFFKEAASNLAPNGRLLIVANRHLGYHKVLKELFRSVTILEDTMGYLILDAR